jgi:hypothetical protein
MIAPLTGEQRGQLEAAAGRATHPADIIVAWWRVALGLADEDWDELGPRSIDPNGYVAEPGEADWLLALLHSSVKPPAARWREQLAEAFINQGPSRRPNP